MLAAAPIVCALLATLQVPSSTLADSFAGSRVRGHAGLLEAAPGPEGRPSPGPRWPSPFTYGEPASGPSSQYNGRVYDQGTGFHDYGARLYWPEIGRFISADPVSGDPGVPASLNRYSYVHNNPYRYIDPSGTTLEVVGGTEFKAKTDAQLNQLAKTETGAKIQKQLRDSEHAFTIVESQGRDSAMPKNAADAERNRRASRTQSRQPPEGPHQGRK